MTSLARQLQKLAIPGQPSMRQVVSKKRPSLLFDAKEAADIDIETIHALGTNGLEELISIDRSFADFETSLFQESYKDFERTVQTRDDLDALDQRISMFLRKLSPYFLLKPAQKCLEWLIRAFRITSFNVDALMECTLPYYETKIFARVVQLLPIKDPQSMWHWLRPIQKAGSPLSKDTLVQHCVFTPSFLTFVCEMIPLSLRAHKSSSVPNAPRAAIAFYSSTVVSLLETQTITEELVSRLLVYVIKGLKSSNVDFRATSYVVVSQLASKAQLEGKLSTSLMDSITKHLGPELVLEGLGCVAVVCQTQESASLSNKALKHLLKLPTFLVKLSELSRQCDLSPFLSLLLSSLLELFFTRLHTEDEGGGEVAMEMMLGLLDEVTLEEAVVATFISHLLRQYVSFCDHLSVSGHNPCDPSAVKAAVAPLAQSLDAKYPKAMDKALELAVATMVTADRANNEEEEEEEEEEKVKAKVEWLHEFVTFSLPGSRHQIVSKRKSTDTTLVLSMYHPDAGVRAMAIRQLGKSLKHKPKSSTASGYDSEFVSTALLGRLEDDNPTVVLATLDLGAKVLFKHLPSADLITALTKIISRRRLTKSSSDWQSCALRAVDHLTSEFLLDSSPKRNDDVTVALLPLMFVGRHGGLFTESVVRLVAGSCLAESHPLLMGMKEEIVECEAWQCGCEKSSGKDPQLLAAANEAMMKHWGRQLGQMEARKSLALATKLFSAVDSTSPDEHAYFQLLTLLAVAMATATHAPSTQLILSLRLQELVEKNINVLEQELGESHIPPSPAAFLQPFLGKHPNYPRAHLLLLLWLLGMISEGLLIPPQLSTRMWLEVPHGDSEEELYHSSLLSLFSLLTHCVDSAFGVTGDVRKAKQGRGGGVGVVESCKYLLFRMTKRHFSGRGALLRFLAMIWTAPPGMESGHHPTNKSHSHSTITAVLQARSLAVAAAYLRSLNPSAAIALLGSHCPVVPSLLVPLLSPYKDIRDSALTCLSLLQTAATSLDPTSLQEAMSANPLIHLVEAICRSKLEISTDPVTLQQLLGKLFRLEVDFASQGISEEEAAVEEAHRRRSKRRKKEEVWTKAAILERILQSLLLHVVTMGAPAHIQLVLLRSLRDVDSPTKLVGLLPLLKRLLDRLSMSAEVPMETNQPKTQTVFPLSEREGLVLHQVITCYSPAMAPVLQTQPEVLQLFCRLLATTCPCAPNVPTAQELALEQVVPEFFARLPSTSIQQQLLGQLIDLLLDSQRSKVILAVKEKIRELPLSSELVIEELNRHVDQLGGKTVDGSPVKKTRHSEPPLSSLSPSSPYALARPWHRVTVLLEVIQGSSSSISDPHFLLSHLFNILSKCLEEEQVDQSALEYTQQLLLSSLLDLCTHLCNQGVDSARALLPESQFNVELVVQCVRLSTNPQTHHHALLLLGNAATIFPGRVMHNIMPIFTFMGANIMRQDDQYSFQVITKTIDTVIPALIQSGSATSSQPHPSPSRRHHSRNKTPPTTVEGVVTEIIRVFVDAAPHVPEHRRLPLFSHLLTTVGPLEYLHVALGLLGEKQVVQAAVKEQTPKEAKMGVAFSLSLAQEFPAPVQILALLRLVEYLASLPEQKPEAAQLRKLPPAVSTLFNVVTHSPKELRHFKALSLSFASQLLSRKTFILKASSLDVKSSTELEATILKLLQCVLSYIGCLRKSRSSCSDEGETKFWEGLLKRAYDIIDRVISLLTLTSFVEIMSQLVSQTGGDVQKKTVDILITRLEDKATQFSGEQEVLLLKLVELLVGVAMDSSSPPANRNSTLHACRLLAKRMALLHPQEFYKVAQAVLSLVPVTGEGVLHSKVQANALLCLAELSTCLGPYLIPLLPSLLPCVLQRVGEVQESREQLHQSAITALSAIVQSLPNFLSSYINDILCKVCHPHLLTAATKSSSQLVKLAAELREKVAGAVPPRALLPAYSKCYPIIVNQGKDSVVALFQALSTTVTSLSKDDVKAHAPLLTEVFMAALDYRDTQKEESMSVLLEVETCCIQGFTNLVVKLSEASFRPLFLKLLNWATHPSSPTDRAITFYHLADSVAEQLKNLFLLFAGHLVKSASALLDSNNEEKQDEDDILASEKASLLLGYILDCLGKCFLYDKGSFLTKERFDTLLQPLVDQVSNCLGGEEVYQRRVEAHLVPCLAQFAVAAGKDSLRKKLNYQLLLTARHSSPQVRFAVLKVLKELYTKWGEEFLVLLPETIPFLAELMEDESVEVERQTQSVITTIEEVLGESIQQYF